MRWIKAQASYGLGDCVELAPAGDGGVLVRDSKDRGELHEVRLHFTRAEFAAFLDGAKGGEFDHLVAS